MKAVFVVDVDKDELGEAEELKPCPFCGAEAEFKTIPLWHGSRGYHGCYEFRIRCKKCGAQPNYPQNDTVYLSV